MVVGFWLNKLFKTFFFLFVCVFWSVGLWRMLVMFDGEKRREEAMVTKEGWRGRTT